ncbi:Gfo/Idh/MocA family protein [Rhodococcus sp. NPDC057529]|uniref:Gfo/Idh/MocA family protein n=1 Tax=Rhodococcus sp. NPDC057529 TaxID=3346158 RepID=UPI0036731106
MPNKIRLGLVGASLSSRWASESHFPALAASPDVELTAVCTSRRESAEAARVALGTRLAFHDYREMVNSPEIDAVGVVLRVPQHYEPTKAALEAGKHVYTEWPLARNTAEAEELAALARSAGVQTVVGLQSRLSPTLMYVKELLESGYLGEVLSYNVSGFRYGGPSERPSSRSWLADVANGANTLTIAFGHVIDTLRFVAGDFAQMRSLLSVQTPKWHETDTGRTVDVTAPDDVQVSARLISGAVASVHVAATPWAGTGFRMEIYGRDGTMVVSNSISPQRGEALRLQAARGTDELADLEIPDRFVLLPADFPRGNPFNVGQLYSVFAEAIRTGNNAAPTFETAVDLHRVLDDVTRSSELGQVDCV